MNSNILIASVSPLLLLQHRYCDDNMSVDDVTGMAADCYGRVCHVSAGFAACWLNNS